MLYENTPEGRFVYRPQDKEEALHWMEMTLPAMLTQTTFVVKTFFDAVSRANPTVSANTQVYKVPAAMAMIFEEAISAIDKCRQKQMVERGGVFIPYEGTPWTGFRIKSAMPADLNRDLISDNNIFEQLLSSGVGLAAKFSAVNGGDGKVIGYEVSRRYLEHLVSIYTCPAAEKWRPGGFRYKEVQNALVEATRDAVNKIDAQVMSALALIPESRVMPRFSEIMQDAEIKTVSRRVTTKQTLEQAQVGMGLDGGHAEPSQARDKPKSPTNQGFKVEPVELQSSWQF